MIKSNIKREFNCDKEKLWNIITDNENYIWRSDLSHIKIIDDTHFIEYDNKRFQTNFTITSKDYLKKYEFNIENENIKGKCTGLFKELYKGKVELEFIEEVETDKIIMKLFGKLYLKNQQKKYMNDLEKELKYLDEKGI